MRSLILIMALMLSGCATNHAECPIGDGAGCKSVSEVNALVNSGELESQSNGEMALSIIDTQEHLPVSITRTPEKTGRVWMSGFEDENGDYVKETYVYTVLNGGQWVNVK